MSFESALVRYTACKKCGRISTLMAHKCGPFKDLYTIMKAASKKCDACQGELGIQSIKIRLSRKQYKEEHNELF